MKHSSRCLSLTLSLGFALCSVAEESPTPAWNQFRGPNGQGNAPGCHIPDHFDPATNLVWKTPVPPGHSSPIIIGQKVFLTAFDSAEPGELATLGIDLGSGKVSWRQSVRTESSSGFHALNNPAASTPAADASQVYSYFGTYGVVCYDHQGKLVWERRLPAPRSKYGMATSPILFKDTVILVLDADDKSSRILALKKSTGESAWEQTRPLFKSSWSTPMLFQHGNRADLVVLGSKLLTAYDPATGEERWWAGGFPDETVGVPVTGDGLLFAGAAALGGRGDEKFDAANTWRMTLAAFDLNHDNQIQREEMTRGFGFIQRPELPRDNPGYAMPIGDMDNVLKMFDKNKDGVISELEWMQTMAGFESFSLPYLAAFRPGADGDARTNHLAWESRRGIPESPSLLHSHGRLYMVRDGGMFTCLQATTGKEIYRERVGAGGQYIASPIAAGDTIIVASTSGVVTVIRAGDTFRILATNDFKEEIFATPALAGNRIFLRTASALYACGE